MKRFTAIVLTLLMVFALTACGGDKGSDTAAPQELHIVPPELATNFDIVTNTSDSASLIVSGSVFEQLVSVNSDYEPVAELCTKWDINDDCTQYTYYLREGVKFHNGEEMTADDVVASMNRWIDSVEAVSGFVGGSHFEKVDDYTVTIKMETPFAYLNNLIGAYANRPVITPASVIENIDDTGVMTEYIGTGPYKFGEMVEDQYVKLEKFDDYTPYGTKGDFSGWAGYKSAPIETVCFDFLDDENTITAGLQTGQVHVTSGIGSDTYDIFANDDNFTVSLNSSEMPMLIFNKAEGLAADAGFRRGINAALNNEEILYGAYGSEDFFSLNSSYMFPTQDKWYTEAGSENYNQANSDKAKEILTEAGYDFKEPFKILVASDSPDFYSMAVVIKGQLEKAGIPCEILTYDWNTFVTIRNEEPDKYNAFITAFGPKPVPSMNLYLSLGWAGWCTDERIQNDLQSINSSASVEEGSVIWKDLQEYMWTDNMPVVNLGIKNVLMVSSADVSGLSYMERISYVNAYFND